jgi:hypothetical protein
MWEVVKATCVAQCDWAMEGLKPDPGSPYKGVLGCDLHLN